MRALTVRQPWADAIVFGDKTVENRTWATSWRGPLLIHAATQLDRDGRHDLCNTGCQHPLGVALGIVAVVDCHPATHCYDPATDRCCSLWANASGWHWVLDNPRPLPTPIRLSEVGLTGRLGLWTFPDTLLPAETGSPATPTLP